MMTRFPTPLAHDTPFRTKSFIRSSQLEQVIRIDFLICQKSSKKRSSLLMVLDFQVKFGKIKGTKLVEVEIALKKEFTRNSPKNVNEQTLTSGKMGNGYI